VPDEPKLNVTVAPGLAALKSVPNLANASVSDAAADTVIVPVTFGAVVVVVVAFGFAALDDELPHATSADPVMSASATTPVRRANTLPPLATVSRPVALR
jgi:hypothetical protein